MSDTLFDFHDVFEYDVIYFNLTFYQTEYSNKSKSQLSRCTFTDCQQTNEPRPLERLTCILSRGGTFSIGNPECKQTACTLWFNTTTMTTIIQYGIQPASIGWSQWRT